jgi:hypothetical protein
MRNVVDVRQVGCHCCTRTRLCVDVANPQLVAFPVWLCEDCLFSLAWQIANKARHAEGSMDAGSLVDVDDPVLTFDRGATE